MATAIVYSFFQAGAIAMAVEALETGKTGQDTMWIGGRKHYISIFLAYLAIAAAFMGVYLLMVLFFALLNMLTSWSALFFLIMPAFMIFLLIAYLSLVLTPYALVIDNLGALDAIMKSVNFFCSNKKDVLKIAVAMVIASLTIAAIGVILSQVPYALYVWIFAGTAINFLALPALYTLWWTDLYLNHTGKKLYGTRGIETFS